MHDHRMRCPLNNKFVFETKASAERKMLKLQKKKYWKRSVDRVLHAYECRHCGWWHLGHTRRREDGES